MDNLLKIRDQLVNKKSNFPGPLSFSMQDSIALQNEINKTNKMIRDVQFGTQKVSRVSRSSLWTKIALAILFIAIFIFFFYYKHNPQDEE